LQTQTFSTNASPNIRVSGCRGRLTIDTWDERAIEVEVDDLTRAATQDDNGLAIRDAIGELRLRVPTGATIAVTKHDGDVRIAAAAGAVRLRDIYGSVAIEAAESLAIERDEEPRRRQLLHHVRRDVEVRDTRTVEIAAVPDHLTLDHVEHAIVGAVGGNVTTRTIAGDLRVGSVGGSCSVDSVGGSLEIGSVGGACEVKHVAASLSVENVGGSASFSDVGAVLDIGSVGGNLNLAAAVLATERATRLSVGGSARIELPNRPNLTIRATVGGWMSGANGTGYGGVRTVVYGDGAAQLRLTVGGNLTLQGGA
jgi:hypothetical protein